MLFSRNGIQCIHQLICLAVGSADFAFAAGPFPVSGGDDHLSVECKDAFHHEQGYVSLDVFLCFKAATRVNLPRYRLPCNDTAGTLVLKNRNRFMAVLEKSFRFLPIGNDILIVLVECFHIVKWGIPLII